MPTLVLIRHSKAEAHRDDDHARQLAPRGRADAAQLREWLTEREVEPDRVVVSTALRTRETWECCSVGSVPPVFDDRLYEASVDDLRAVIAETDPLVQVLVLVGHNPGVEQLAWALDDADGARDKTNTGMRTSGAAVFHLDSWGAQEATLQHWR